MNFDNMEFHYRTVVLTIMSSDTMNILNTKKLIVYTIQCHL